MVRTIIHGARIGGGGGPNGVQHTGIKFPSYCRGGGGQSGRGCWFYHHAVKYKY